jgi:hypothetical protein
MAGGISKKIPVSLLPKARPTVKDKSIKYLVLSIKYLGKDLTVALSVNFIERYIEAIKKSVRKDSVVPKWADWIRPGEKAAIRAATIEN